MAKMKMKVKAAIVATVRGKMSYRYATEGFGGTNINSGPKGQEEDLVTRKKVVNLNMSRNIVYTTGQAKARRLQQHEAEPRIGRSMPMALFQ
jgi:hypothetical protein